LGSRKTNTKATRMERISTTKARRALRDVLLDARRKAGLSQREVARKLGRHQSYVARYESGTKRRILLTEFVAIARALGHDPARLLRAVMRKMR
jgi:transcriptional regulator with XRE-family HTH domain